jgi:hypothetical protein
LNVIVGVRKNGTSWKEAQEDGWVPGKNLFDIDEAIGKATIVMNLLSDAAQSETWPQIKPQLTEGKVSNDMFGVLGEFADCNRRFTSPTVSPLSSRTSPRSMFPQTSMSSLSHPRAPAAPSALSSVRAAVSTPPSLSSKMSLARPRRRPLLSV